MILVVVYSVMKDLLNPLMEVLVIVKPIYPDKLLMEEWLVFSRKLLIVKNMLMKHLALHVMRDSIRM